MPDLTPEPDQYDLQDFLPYLLNQAAEEVSLGFQAEYKGRYGLLRTEWRVLFHLGLYTELTATEIGQRAKLHKTKISRAVSRLEERRLLKRDQVAADRRKEVLMLTPTGNAVYEDLRGAAQRYEAQVVKGLSAEETALLHQVLQKLVKA